MKKSCSLIIATYNWPSALRLCLDSVLAQVVMPDEIIIADDGSGEETASVIKEYQSQFSIPLKHIWQPDDGYQLARIRNKAFAAASSEYMVQVDGDLILQPYFIADHLRFCKKGTFVSGARAWIDEEFSKKIIRSLDASEISIGSAHVRKKFNAVRSHFLSTANYLFQRTGKSFHYVLGCNMAFWKKDLEKVNGYNEAFTGWGKEDNDLAVRLMNAGIKLRFVKFSAIVYHLHHKISDRPHFAENDALFKKSIQNKITYVEKGIDQHKGAIIKL